jgi:hypothetical protein
VAIEDVTPARAGQIGGTGRGSQESHEAPSPHGSLVDPYVGRYAARAQEMVASEIRALFAVAARPEIVSLAGGMPASSWPTVVPWPCSTCRRREIPACASASVT